MKRLVIFALLLGVGRVAAEGFTQLKADEQIVFYPTVAQRVPERNVWRAEIRGSVFEPEKARVSVAALRKALEFKAGKLTAAEEEIFSRRARLFLVDHERRKEVFVRLGTNEFFVGKSGADGNFSGQIEFPNMPAPISFSAVLSLKDQRQFTGQVFPLAEEGMSVISDIDDTIKITEVRDSQATLRNTFLREFQPVPGMAQFYRSATNEQNIGFHYVSASPWQLYEPLTAFAASNGFPSGTFTLKQFRWKDRSFLSLFADPEQYKPAVIEPLLKQFPKRLFVLIGDSGERDPEIYGALARKFPEQILRILIRDVTNETVEATRYQQAFRGVPVEKWQIFREPGEIKCLCE